MLPKSKKSTLLFVVISIAAVAIGLLSQQSMQRADKLPTLEKIIILPNSKVISGVDFIDHAGQPFTAQNLQNHWSILFFGFTNCPDICPTTMQALKQVKQQLSEAKKWGNYQVIMVSVDPKRDTPERLAKYVPYFDSEFIGITGNIETTTQFAKQLGILFVSHESDEQDSDDVDPSYDVDHSAALILLNPKGQMAGVISAPHNVEEISNDLIKLADHFKKDHTLIIPAKTDNKHNKTALTAKLTPETTQNPQGNSATLIIRNAWIRPAPPNVKTMAAYFELINESDQDITIIDSQSPQFDMTMIHDTIIEKGIAKMQHLNALVIPAHSKVSLAPMAKHMMLMGNALAIGQSAQITLIDENGSYYTQKIEVRDQPK